MSWHKITLPIPPRKEIDPKVVEIGDLAKACYAEANKPAGFGMLHASRTSDGNELEHDTRIVYLSPVAYELCHEVIGERYTLEPCDVPARDEPGLIWVFGDPLVMGMLADKYEWEQPLETESVS
ncbi:MAG TPA: hypothetical protein VN659_16940 [Pyrinomonadaceae bacterium]|nr:hypothetical protein [Pyrinomonadaceae bacterium]